MTQKEYTSRLLMLKEKLDTGNDTLEDGLRFMSMIPTGVELNLLGPSGDDIENNLARDLIKVYDKKYNVISRILSGLFMTRLQQIKPETPMDKLVMLVKKSLDLLMMMPTSDRDRYYQLLSQSAFRCGIIITT